MAGEFEHTFENLAATVLPGNMSRLRASMTLPIPMSEFAQVGVGPQTLLKKVGRSKDFGGCYVLLDGEKPFYVGISRAVFGRLRQHVNGRTHCDASLAYLIAYRQHPHRTIEKLTRAQNMADPLFGTSFAEAQTLLRSLNVATVEIESAVELYVFEVYCALELSTHQWNSFKTH